MEMLVKNEISTARNENSTMLKRDLMKNSTKHSQYKKV